MAAADAGKDIKGDGTAICLVWRGVARSGRPGRGGGRSPRAPGRWLPVLGLGRPRAGSRRQRWRGAPAGSRSRGCGTSWRRPPRRGRILADTLGVGGVAVPAGSGDLGRHEGRQVIGLRQRGNERLGGCQLQSASCLEQRRHHPSSATRAPSSRNQGARYSPPACRTRHFHRAGHCCGWKPARPHDRG